MAARAIGLVRGASPGNHLVIRCVTRVTGPEAMSLVANADVAVSVGGRPHGRTMTGVATACRDEMRRTLHLCIHGGVRTAVTGRAIARCDRPRCASVAHDGRLKRCVILVTGVTLRGSRDMSRSLVDLRGAARHMARRTRTRRGSGVRKRRAGPHRCRPVARIALRGCRHVRLRFRLCVD